MKRAEKIIYGVAILLLIAAVAQAVLRPAPGKTAKKRGDFVEWSPAAVAGYDLYKRNGCNSCHRVLRMGEVGVAPVLDGEGTRRTQAWLEAYFDDPVNVVPGSAHDGHLGPDFRRLYPDQRHRYVQFMMALKTRPGSSNYPVHPALLKQHPGT